MLGAHVGRGNHKNIFTDCGVEWREYRYFDKATIGLDFEGMTADLEAAPDGSVVVLHGARGWRVGLGPYSRHACGSSSSRCGAEAHGREPVLAGSSVAEH